jgi:hypothetical protein
MKLYFNNVISLKNFSIIIYQPIFRIIRYLNKNNIINVNVKNSSILFKNNFNYHMIILSQNYSNELL